MAKSVGSAKQDAASSEEPTLGATNSQEKPTKQKQQQFHQNGSLISHAQRLAAPSEKSVSCLLTWHFQVGHERARSIDELGGPFSDQEKSRAS